MMEHHTNHIHHQEQRRKAAKGNGIFPLALSATFHCLLGCGLGEIMGVIIGQIMNLAMVPTMILALVLGFFMGMLLGIVPLLRRKFSLPNALKTVLVGEGLSIVVMESFELLTQMVIPGVMAAGLSDGLFWLGMGAGLVAGFITALPVNYFMIKRGIRHMH